MTAQKEIGHLLSQVRQEKPLVHNMTNVVVTNFTANGLLALGASPVMAYAKEEVADMAKIAGALVLNMGTLTSTEVEAMIIAGKAANEAGVPVIFDPVGAGATPFRTATARELLNKVNIAVIRGNAAEIANVVGENWAIKGVDAAHEEGDVVTLAKMAAKQLKTVVVVTGVQDVVSDGDSAYIITNGHSMLANVTGTGCLLTSVIGAFVAVEKKRIVEAVLEALCAYEVAAELAADKAAGEGPGSFQTAFLDALHHIHPEQVKSGARVEQQ